jgi:nucleotide-binding universal stress UspA family protein
MIAKILVAYDGSDPSEKAFRLALEFARRFEAPVEVLSVVRPPDFTGGAVETTALVDSGRAYFQDQFRRLDEIARAAAVQARFHYSIGHPADQIVARAKEDGVDLIVMGHRGKSLVERWLTGSVTKQVMGYAHCPVLIVR